MRLLRGRVGDVQGRNILKPNQVEFSRKAASTQSS
jgi:hypothetical protein